MRFQENLAKKKLKRKKDIFSTFLCLFVAKENQVSLEVCDNCF